MPRVAFYITGHGFGHAMRAITVMNALGRAIPGLELFIRSLAPARLFEECLEPRAHIEAVQTDTGGRERNILFTDEEASIAEAVRFHEHADEVADREARFLRETRIDLVLSDVPPLASEIADRAAVRSIAFANFTWDRIYSDYPGSADLVERLQGYYRKTTLALEVPLGHAITVFPRRQRIPIIARRSSADRDAVRRELGLNDDQIAVQVGLKGAELHDIPLACADPRIVFLATAGIEGPSVRTLGDEWRRRFPDVMVASDVVLSKPGYGILSECIANRRPLIHLPRMGFAETAPMMAEAGGLLPHLPIGLDDISSQALQHSILRLYESSFPWPETRIDGADVAARIVKDLLMSETGNEGTKGT